MSPISRRDFIGGVLGAALPSVKSETAYIAAYDTESPACLQACRKIVEVHKRLKMPATFFITGKTLEGNAGEYKELLAHPLFEVASHTWSHKMLRENVFCGPAASATPGPACGANRLTGGNSSAG